MDITVGKKVAKNKTKQKQKKTKTKNKTVERKKLKQR